MIIVQQVHHPLVERNKKKVPGVMAVMAEELAIQVYLDKYKEKYKLRKKKPTLYLPLERVYDLLILSNSTTHKTFNQFLCEVYKSPDLHAVELRNGKETFSLYMHPDIMFNYIKRKVKARIRKEIKSAPSRSNCERGSEATSFVASPKRSALAPATCALGEGSETPTKVSS